MVCVVYSSLPLTILNFGASLANLAEPAQNSKLLVAMDIPSPASEDNFVPDLLWSLYTYLDNICNDTNSQKRLWRQVPKKQHSWPWIVMEWWGAFHNSCPVQTLLGDVWSLCNQRNKISAKFAHQTLYMYRHRH